MRVAIIDLGSNSVRMSIAEISGKDVSIIENHRTVVRLSEGMGDEKILQKDAVWRTLSVLRSFRRIINEKNIDKIYSFATAALRTASNKEIFIEPVKRLGFEFEILSGEKEAYYDFMGVVNTLSVNNCVIMDIGGASTELILVKDGKKENLVSIPFASVNITEKYFSGTVATDNEMKNAVDKFTDELKKIDWLFDAKNYDIVGLGGSVKALSMLRCKENSKLHGFCIDKEILFSEIKKLVTTPLEERVLMEGLGKGRGDIILGGVVPLIAVMNYINSPRLVACLTGLREGVMYDIAQK